MRKAIGSKCSRIKLVITDVDGVLTDGGMYYSRQGDVMKKFHTRDGMGVTLLRKTKIPTIILTKENTEIVRKWAKKMKIERVYDGVIFKDEKLDEICKKFHVKPIEIAFIGDDVNDMKLLRKVGFSATPNDGIKEVKEICDYVCEVKGGRGALREIADMILKSR